MKNIQNECYIQSKNVKCHLDIADLNNLCSEYWISTTPHTQHIIISYLVYCHLHRLPNIWPNKPLQGMAPTECLPSACLSACLLACSSACLPFCLPTYLPACLPACLRMHSRTHDIASPWAPVGAKNIMVDTDNLD